MLNTITENRLKNNVKAFLDYVTYQKQPVLVARDDGNVVMIPQEMYEAVEEYMQMREAQELAGPRALPQAESMQKVVPPASEPVDKPEGLKNDAIDWAQFPEAQEILHPQEQEKQEDEEQPKTYSFTKPEPPKDDKEEADTAKAKDSEDTDEDKAADAGIDYDADKEFDEIRQQIAERVKASLEAKGIYLPHAAFEKLVDEAINEIARGNMDFFNQLDDLPNADGFKG